jgi:hypothetical protein
MGECVVVQMCRLRLRCLHVRPGDHRYLGPRDVYSTDSFVLKNVSGRAGTELLLFKLLSVVNDGITMYVHILASATLILFCAMLAVVFADYISYTLQILVIEYVGVLKVGSLSPLCMFTCWTVKDFFEFSSASTISTPCWRPWGQSRPA